MKWARATIVLAAGLWAGCLPLTTTTEVRVANPTQVALAVRRDDGFHDVTLPLGAQEAVVIDSGQYGYGDDAAKRPYEIIATRLADGGLRLDCKGCTGIAGPSRSGLLVAGDGTVRPTLAGADERSAVLTVFHDNCFVYYSRHPCEVPLLTALHVAWPNVTHAEDVTRTDRSLGGLLTGAGGLFIGGGVLAVADPSFNRSHSSDLIILDVLAFGIGAAVLGLGLYQLVLPTKHHPLRPR
jgi:hypothetical protein